MLLPSKSTKSTEAIFCIASFVAGFLNDSEKTFDEVLEYLSVSYPAPISVESLILAFDFLYMIDRVEVRGDSFRIKLK